MVAGAGIGAAAVDFTDPASGSSARDSQPAATSQTINGAANARATGRIIGSTYGWRNVRFISVARCILLSMTVSCPAAFLPRKVTD